MMKRMEDVEYGPPAEENGFSPSWGLLWSDEFDGPQGTPPDPLKWRHDRGGGGWGNQEKQYYTDRPENAALDGNGCLAITAQEVPEAGRSGLECWYGPCRFTSARLLTRDTFTFAWGRVEARMRLPWGQGLWPALWMLGNDIGEVGWPNCGEIDIMENIGREPDIVHGTVHGPGYCGGQGIGGLCALAGGQAFKDAFHCFAVEWQPGIIRWFMDGQPYFEVHREQIPQGAPWPFEHPFFLLLNLAVGGLWPGYPDETTVFPQTFSIDYVRVFQKA